VTTEAIKRNLTFKWTLESPPHDARPCWLVALSWPLMGSSAGWWSVTYFLHLILIDDVTILHLTTIRPPRGVSALFGRELRDTDLLRLPCAILRFWGLEGKGKGREGGRGGSEQSSYLLRASSSLSRIVINTYSEHTSARRCRRCLGWCCWARVSHGFRRGTWGLIQFGKLGQRSVTTIHWPLSKCPPLLLFTVPMWCHVRLFSSLARQRRQH
jgi:hypothetical protein